jgi:hypothetical protein
LPIGEKNSRDNPLAPLSDPQQVHDNFVALQVRSLDGSRSVTVTHPSMLSSIPADLSTSSPVQISLHFKDKGLKALDSMSPEWPGMLKHSPPEDRGCTLTVTKLAGAANAYMIEAERIPPAADCPTWDEAVRFLHRMARWASVEG